MITDGITNIIFDLGVVLVGLDTKQCLDAFDSIGAHAIVEYVQEHRTENLFLDTETGRITQAEFCNRVREISSYNASDEQIVWAWNQLLTEIPDYKKELLLDLRANHRVFLLSNTNIMHWNLCRDEMFKYKGFGVNDYFEHIFLSYEMHKIKPNADIFEEVVTQTGIKPNETLFIDDRLDNCEAAKSLGINILHETTGDDWVSQIKINI